MKKATAKAAWPAVMGKGILATDNNKVSFFLRPALGAVTFPESKDIRLVWRR